jgi:hypothetical protein
MHEAITLQEQKNTVLQLSKRYGVEEIAKMVDLPKEEVRKLQESALRDLQSSTDELGRAYAMLHLQKIEHCEEVMMNFVEEFRELAKVNEEGKITDNAQAAVDIVLKSVDAALSSWVWMLPLSFRPVPMQHHRIKFSAPQWTSRAMIPVTQI